jgi:membrane protein required for beta-lactamase induction
MTTNQPESDDRLEQIARSQQQVLERLDKLSADVERSNDKFTTYQQATQWVVQLAFSLIASATVLVIISTVFKR